MEKTKKRLPTGVMLCIAALLLLFLFSPSLERRTWVLTSAQMAEAPYSVVAHHKDYDISAEDGPLFAFSKPIELVCEAKDGKLTLTDKTNGKTYEGTYTPDGLVIFGRFRLFGPKSYTVTVEDSSSPLWV